MKKSIAILCSLALVASMAFIGGCDKGQEKPSTISVVFNTDGGNEVAMQTLDNGDTLAFLPTPTKEGYTFLKWVDAVSGEKITADTVFTKDTEIKAVWDAIEFKVYYYSANYRGDHDPTYDVAIHTEKVDYGKAATYTLEQAGYGATDHFTYDWTDLEGNPVDLSNVKSDLHVKASRIDLNTAFYAKYAEGNIVIDGEIDETWENAQKFYTKNNMEDDAQATGYVSVMWTANGLYFLAKITDTTLAALDSVNFWVSEQWTDVEGGYSTNPADGKYAAIITVDGNEKVYNDILQLKSQPNVEIGHAEWESGYIIEIYVPRLSAGSFTEDSYIGFDVSIDDYSYSEERDYCCSWHGEGHYWSNVAALYKLQLKK